MEITHLTYEERSHYCLSPVSKHLFRLMDEKQTNLALSADVTKAEDLLKLAETLGPEICVLKTHIDIIEDFSTDLVHELRRLSHEHHFLLFEDRKFADIGHTAKLQYEGGLYRIVEWADIVNAHTVPGPGIIQGLADVARKKNRGVLLIAELSSTGNLIDQRYTEQTLKMAEQFADFVIGFITQRAISSDPHWINFTPGIKLEEGRDQLGQQYGTPRDAVLEQGTDIIIVGRGIISHDDPLAEAKKYRISGWSAYLERCER